MATHKVSAVTIDEFELPKGRHATGALIAAALMILSARRRFIQPGSVLHDQVIARSARASKYAKPVQDALFYTLYGLHGIETVYFALTKLKKHNVKIFSSVWFKWLIAVFLGGVFVQKHFDEVVEKKELKTIKEI
ncbi:uncharacterized protein PV07_08310 [Cladophialophora immunda]|uniref:Uncharacterized protein n=1 Tax=Cladophialophora immunda TaxID=569365 RepID=A0A0D2ATX3_9EURO|nr:uncharacterized protein PV07_08310 [Cladophialophora immunda]KIW28667.1 hypothetical protein PV07_08310 [Cladophialophora immunda]OQV06453.1 hypothetical protein CLAIMM_11015 [Cladophialophora immunda]